MPTPAAADACAAFAEATAQAGGAFRAYLRRRLREHHLDVTAEMVQVLHYLWRHEHANQQQIARAVHRDKASLTAMLDNLVRRELVTRCADPHDRRSKRIMLTAQGRALEQQVAPLVQEMYAAARQHLPPAQLQACLRTLAHITRNLQPPPP